MLQILSLCELVYRTEKIKKEFYSRKYGEVFCFPFAMDMKQ